MATDLKAACLGKAFFLESLLDLVRPSPSLPNYREVGQETGMLIQLPPQAIEEGVGLAGPSPKSAHGRAFLVREALCTVQVRVLLHFLKG